MGLQEFYDPDKAIQVGDGELLFAIMEFYYLPYIPAKITADPYYSYPEEPEEFEVRRAMIWCEETEQWYPASDTQVDMLQEDANWAERVIDGISDWIKDQEELYNEQRHNSEVD